MLCKKNNLKNNQQGFLLITSLVVLTIMILIVTFYLNAIIQEIKITHITSQSSQAYYLAETGVQEAIWKLQNDSTWKNNFETNPTWSATLTRNNVWGKNGSYTVTVTNTDLANAYITATSSIPVAKSTTQRVVKTSVFKALNRLPTENIAIFTNNNITNIGGDLNATGKTIMANNNISLYFFSDWAINGETKAVNVISTDFGSHLISTGIYDSKRPPTPTAISMPAIDFDSTDKNSYKSRANQIYSSSEFDQLLNDSPIVTLDGITYVTGGVFIKKGQKLILNGILVADGSITVGNLFNSGITPATLIVNHINDQPSGLLSKSNINFGSYNSEAIINGLIYSGGTLTFSGGSLAEGVSIKINGAIISQNINFFNMWLPLTVTLNQDYVDEVIDLPVFSQILSINHWEEKY